MWRLLFLKGHHKSSFFSFFLRGSHGGAPILPAPTPHNLSFISLKRALGAADAGPHQGLRTWGGDGGRLRAVRRGSGLGGWGRGGRKALLVGGRGRRGNRLCERRLLVGKGKWPATVKLTRLILTLPHEKIFFSFFLVVW